MCHYSYHAYFILLYKSEKRVSERNKRLKLWNLRINWQTQPVLDFRWLNYGKWLVPNPMRVHEFFVIRRGSGLFYAAIRLAKNQENNCHLPKFCKNKKVDEYWLTRSQQKNYRLWIAQSQQNDPFENIYVSSRQTVHQTLKQSL